MTGLHQYVIVGGLLRVPLAVGFTPCPPHKLSLCPWPWCLLLGKPLALFSFPLFEHLFSMDLIPEHSGSQKTTKTAALAFRVFRKMSKTAI